MITVEPLVFSYHSLLSYLETELNNKGLQNGLLNLSLFALKKSEYVFTDIEIAAIKQDVEKIEENIVSFAKTQQACGAIIEELIKNLEHMAKLNNQNFDNKKISKYFSKYSDKLLTKETEFKEKFKEFKKNFLATPDYFPPNFKRYLEKIRKNIIFFSKDHQVDYKAIENLKPMVEITEENIEEHLNEILKPQISFIQNIEYYYNKILDKKNHLINKTETYFKKIKTEVINFSKTAKETSTAIENLKTTFEIENEKILHLALVKEKIVYFFFIRNALYKTPLDLSLNYKMGCSYLELEQLGLTYLKLASNCPDHALKYLIKAKDKDDDSKHASALLCLAEFYLDNNRKAEAMNYCRQALILSSRLEKKSPVTFKYLEDKAKKIFQDDKVSYKLIQTVMNLENIVNKEEQPVIKQSNCRSIMFGKGVPTNSVNKTPNKATHEELVPEELETTPTKFPFQKIQNLTPLKFDINSIPEKDSMIGRRLKF